MANGFFRARPHFENRQIVQYMGDSIHLSGQTNFELGGFNSYIYDSYEDFLNGISGATFTSLPLSAATDPISGWSNQTVYSPGIFRIVPPKKIFFSGNTSVITGVTQEDVTGYIPVAFDSQGTVVWSPLSGITSTSGSCSPNFYVQTITPCGTDTLTIDGNLLVKGVTTSGVTIIETETVRVEDNNMELNWGGNHTTAIGGGITVLSGQSNSADSRIYTLSDGTWMFEPGLSARTIPYVYDLGGGSNTDSIITQTGGNEILSSNYSAILAGEDNIISGGTNRNVILGGQDHIMDSSSGYGNSSMLGGRRNVIRNSGNISTIISSMFTNIIDSNYSGIYTSGGDGETANILNSSRGVIIGVGYTNPNPQPYIDYSKNSILVGGSSNIIEGTSLNYILNSAIVGGVNNLISGITNSQFIGGGRNNIIDNSEYSTILGGNGNQIRTSELSSIVGGMNTILQSDYCGIFAGTNNSINGSNNFSTIIGGSNNDILSNANNSFIGGGDNNTINDSDYVSIFGRFNVISGTSNVSGIFGGDSNGIDNSTFSGIVGGNGNRITTDDFSVIIGGGDNKVSSGNNNLIAGGGAHTINNSSESTIIGGNSNTINGFDRSVILGGQNITGTSNDTVYVPYLNIGNTPGGTIVGNLAIDSNGNVITGSTSGLTNYWTVENDGLKDTLGSHTVTTTSQYGLLGGGSGNTLDNATFSTILGGENNIISGHTYGYIIGGKDNLIDFDLADQTSAKEHEGIIGSERSEIFNSARSVIMASLDSKIDESSVSTIINGYGYDGGTRKVLIDGGYYGATNGFENSWNNNIIGLIEITGVDGNADGGILGRALNNTILGSEDVYMSSDTGTTILKHNLISNTNRSKIVSSTYSSLLGSTLSQIQSDNEHAIILGAKSGTIQTGNTYPVIIGGLTNTLSQDSNYTTILNGNVNTIYDSNSYSSIIGSDLSRIYEQNRWASILGSNASYIQSGGTLTSIIASDGIWVEGENTHVFVTNSTDSYVYDVDESTIIGSSGARISGNTASHLHNLILNSDGTSSTNNIIKRSFLSSLINSYVSTIDNQQFATILNSTTSNITDYGNGSGVGQRQSNTIIGGQNNDIISGFKDTIIGGNLNKISYVSGYPSISNGIFAGSGNTISGHTASVILGGTNNLISFDPASMNGILAGKYHTIRGGGMDTILGGQYNTIEGQTISDTDVSNSILGGQYNFIYTATTSTILGGTGNTISESTHSSILGGSQNILYGNGGGIGNNSVIVGGENHIMDGLGNGTILGGTDNIVSGTSNYASMIGGGFNIMENGNVGMLNAAFTNIRANNGANVGWDYSTVLGGYLNDYYRTTFYALPPVSSFIGGYGNTVDLGTPFTFNFITNLNTKAIGDVSISSIISNYLSTGDTLTLSNMITSENSSMTDVYGSTMINGELSTMVNTYANFMVSTYNSDIIGADVNNPVTSNIMIGGESHTINSTVTGPNQTSYNQLIGGANNSVTESRNNTIIGGDNNLITGTSVTVSNEGLILHSETSKIFNSSNFPVIIGSSNSRIENNQTRGTIIAGSGSLIAEDSDGVIIGGTSNILSGNSTTPTILGGTFNQIICEGGSFGSVNAILNSSQSEIIGFQPQYSTIVGGLKNSLKQSVGIFSPVTLVGGNEINVTGKTTSVASDAGTFGGYKNTMYDSEYSYMIGGTGNTIASVDRTIILGGEGITATLSNVVYVPDLVLDNLPSQSVLGTDANGKIIAGTGGGGSVTIDPYEDVGNVNSITWDVSGTSTNYQATLTGNTTLDLTNVRNGDYGTLIVEQDGVGSRTLTFGNVNGGAATHKVVNGGGGSPTLTSTPNAIDILSFTSTDGPVGPLLYWTVGNDYT